MRTPRQTATLVSPRRLAQLRELANLGRRHPEWRGIVRSNRVVLDGFDREFLVDLDLIALRELDAQTTGYELTDLGRKVIGLSEPAVCAPVGQRQTSWAARASTPAAAVATREVTVMRGRFRPEPTIDPGHPDYRRGQRAANTIIDIHTGARVAELLGLAELSASEALQSGDNSRYLKARGAIDMYRDYLAERGDH